MKKMEENTTQEDLQIKSEQHNLMILEFFLGSKTSFWNTNEVTRLAGGSIDDTEEICKIFYKNIEF